MRGIALAIAVAAATTTAEARDGCEDFLSRELRNSAMIVSEDMAWSWRNSLEGAPAELEAEVAEVIRLAEERRSLHRELTAALMRLCAAYPSD